MNAASVTELQGLPEVSRPVARRIVEARPYLAPDPDLLVVSGIGPDELATIVASRLACATPESSPPQVFDPCAPGQLDVNDPAAVGELAALFGGPTAQRVVDGQPFRRLAHLTRVPGVGPGNLAQVGSQLCVTQPTINFDGIQWSWVDGDGVVATNTSEDGTFTLQVPKGAVSEPDGAWASVEPIESVAAAGMDVDVPAADFRIWGDWAGDVTVTVPRDPYEPAAEDEDKWAPAIMSFEDGGPVLYRAATDANSWSADVGSLSFKAALTVPFRYFTSPSLEEDRKAAEIGEQLIRDVTGTGATPPTCTQDVTDRVLDDGTRIETDGWLVSDEWFGSDPTSLTAPVHHCVERRDNDDVAWKLVPNRGVVSRFHAGEHADVESVGFGGPILWSTATAVWNNAAIDDGNGGRAPVMAVGQDVQIAHDGDPAGFNVDVSASTGLTVLYVAMEEVSSLLPASTEFYFSAFAECPNTLIDFGLGYEDNEAVYSTMVDLGRSLTECTRDLIVDGDAAAAEFAAKSSLDVNPSQVVDTVKRASMYLRKARWGSTALDTLVGELADGTIRLTHVLPPTPPPPVGDGGGDSGGGGTGGGDPGGSGPDGTIPAGEKDNLLVRLDLGGSTTGPYLTGENDVAAAVVDDANYACLARRYRLAEYQPASSVFDFWLQESAYPATCDSAVPTHDLPEDATNWILREANGTSWFIDADSQLRWIPDGGTYVCLAQDFFVLDMTPWEDIEPFESDTYAGDMTCT